MPRKFTADFSKDSIESVNQKLAQRRISLAEEIYPQDKISFDDHTGEVRVGSKGSRVFYSEGVQYSFEENAGGSLLSMILEEFGFGFSEALKWAWDFNGRTPIDSHCIVRKSEPSIKDTPEIAERCWKRGRRDSESMQRVIGYFKSRSIAKPNEYALDKISLSPAEYHVASDQFLPCMLVRLERKDGEFAGVLRTFLSKKNLSKASVRPNKMVLGCTRGSAMHLAPAGHTVVITEGLEDALSLQQMDSKHAVWAYPGSAILTCQFPDVVKHVVIATDNDEAGIAYRSKLFGRLTAQGYKVTHLYAEGAKDFNEQLCNGGV